MYTGQADRLSGDGTLHEFQKCVARYGGDYKSRGFSCRDRFLCLSVAQLTFRESLRDIESCLRSVPEKLHHLGFRGRIARSTLADANEIRNWRIYADFAQALIQIARPMYASDPAYAAEMQAEPTLPALTRSRTFGRPDAAPS